MRITKLQKKFLEEISEFQQITGREYPVDGVAEHNRAYKLEDKGLITFDFYSRAKLTDAGRAALKGQQHDK